MDPLLLWFGEQVVLPEARKRALAWLSAKDWTDTLAREACRDAGIRIGRRVIRKWLRLSSTWDLLVQPSTTHAQELAGSLDALMSASPYFAWRPEATRQSLAETVSGAAGARFLTALDPSQATAISDLRNQVRFQEVVDRLPLEGDFTDAARKLPPWCTPWIEQLARQSRPGAARLVRLLVPDHPLDGPGLDDLVAHPPTSFEELPVIAWVAVGEAANGRGAFRAASIAFERAASEGAPVREHWIRRASFAAIQADDPDRARTLLSDHRSAESSPFGKAILAYLDDDWVTVRRLPEELGDAAVDEWVLHLTIKAEAELRLDDSGAGILLLEKALRASPTSAGIALTLAHVLASRASREPWVGRGQDLLRAQSLALEARNQRRAWGGDSSQAVKWLCDIATLRGDYEEALQFALPPPAGEATPAEAQSKPVKVTAASLLIASGQDARAQVLVDGLDNAFDVAWLTGTLEHAKGNKAQAVEHFKNAWPLASDDEQRLTAAKSMAATGAALPDPAWIETQLPEVRAEVLGAALIAEGNHQEAIPMLRPHWRVSRSVTALLLESYRATGQVDSAVQLANEAAARFNDPHFYVEACGHLARENRWDAAVETANDALRASEALVESDRFKLRLLLIDSAWRQGDWREVESQCRMALSEGSENQEFWWSLIGSQFNSGRANDAWDSFRESSVTPSSDSEAQIAFQLYRRFSTNVKDVEAVLDLADQFPESEMVRADALIAAYTMARTEQIDETVLGRLHAQTEDFVTRFPDSSSFRRFEFTTPEKFFEEAREILETRSDTYEELAVKVSAGELPCGLLSSAARKSYTEALIRRAPGCLPIVATNHEIQDAETRAATEAIDGDLVLDISAVHIASLVPEAWSRVKATYRSLYVVSCCIQDAQNALDALSHRSTASMSWDRQQDRPVLSEITPEEADAIATRAAWMLDELRGLEAQNVQSYEHLGEVGFEDTCSWLGPVELAKSRGLPLYSDDVGTRALARSLGVAAFGTVGFMYSVEVEQREREDIFAKLASNYCVDLPDQIERTGRLGGKVGWVPGPASFAFTRAASWANPRSTMDQLIANLKRAREIDPSHMIGWIGAGAAGLSRTARDEKAAASAGAVYLLEVVERLGETAIDLAEGLRIIRTGLEAGGFRVDPIEPLTQMLMDRFRSAGEGDAPRMVLNYLSPLSPEDRANALESILRSDRR